MAKGSSDKRNDMLRKITDLFLLQPQALQDEHVNVFDVVIARMAVAIEEEARAELAERLADIPNAPPNVVRRLANDEITIAKPILERSPRLTDTDLVSIAMAKGQGHLLAISGRNELSEKITDVLVSRGDNSVKAKVAGNNGAKLSGRTFERLAAQARNDESLRGLLTQRVDIPQERLQSLITIASDAARKNLSRGTEDMSDAAKAALQQALERSANKVSDRLKSQQSTPQIAKNQNVQQTADMTFDYQKVLPVIRQKHENQDLTEFDLAAYAAHHAKAEAIATISFLTSISLASAERLFTGQDQDLLLIICKSQNWSWSTVKALIKMRANDQLSQKQIEKSHESYEQLTQSTAERVLKFLHVREASQSRQQLKRT